LFSYLDVHLPELITRFIFVFPFRPSGPSLEASPRSGSVPRTPFFFPTLNSRLSLGLFKQSRSLLSSLAPLDFLISFRRESLFFFAPSFPCSFFPPSYFPSSGCTATRSAGSCSFVAVIPAPPDLFRATKRCPS